MPRLFGSVVAGTFAPGTGRRRTVAIFTGHLLESRSSLDVLLFTAFCSKFFSKPIIMIMMTFNVVKKFKLSLRAYIA